MPALIQRRRDQIWEILQRIMTARPQASFAAAGRNERSRQFGPLIWLAVLVVLIPIVSSCSVLQSSAEKSLHQHAANAAIAMGNTPIGTSGVDMARAVAGNGTDDTIQVLTASGTRRSGVVVLRINVTVKPTSDLDSGSKAVGCFRYQFDYDAEPDEVSCPNRRPLVLPPAGPATTTTVS